MRDPGKESIRHGFTLIELLVVIAIIARPDRPAAARGPGGPRGGPAGQCTNNLKQIGLPCTTMTGSNSSFPVSGIMGWKRATPGR